MPVLSAVPSSEPLLERSILGVRRMRLRDYRKRLVDRGSPCQIRGDGSVRSKRLKGGEGVAMMRLRPWGDDDLGVVISLAVVFGMIVGALAVLWIAGGGVEIVVRWLS